MAKQGRKPKLTEADKAKILEILNDGGSRNLAASIVKCAPSTIQNTADREPAFLDALKAAEGECEVYHLRRIKTGDKAWQSSAWFLERKWPKRYARREYLPDENKSQLIKVRPLEGGNTRDPSKPNADSGSTD